MRRLSLFRLVLPNDGRRLSFLSKMYIIIFTNDVGNERVKTYNVPESGQNPCLIISLVMGARRSAYIFTAQCMIECRRTYDNIRVMRYTIL